MTSRKLSILEEKLTPFLLGVRNLDKMVWLVSCPSSKSSIESIEAYINSVDDNWVQFRALYINELQKEKSAAMKPFVAQLEKAVADQKVDDELYNWDENLDIRQKGAHPIESPAIETFKHKIRATVDELNSAATVNLQQTVIKEPEMWAFVHPDPFAEIKSKF